MARNTAPTVLAKAMLNQEVRGIRQLNLLASPEVAAAVTKALEEARRPRVHFQVGETRLGETMEVQQVEASSDEDKSIEEVVQRLYNWSSGETEANKLHNFQNYKISNEEDNYVKARLKGEAL
ncbi:hypothetical protein CFE70_001258 [Pyrenophora teres f. teres 0-1]